MARKKIWVEVTTITMSYFDYDPITDVIARLTEISTKYPGARIVERGEDYSDYKVMAVQIYRDETDAEMEKREQQEAAQHERNQQLKRAQYEQLKREFGGDAP